MAIPEIDVLIATAIWLHKKGYTLESISIPKRQTMSALSQREKLYSKFTTSNIPLTNGLFRPDGPDIIAHFERSSWKIECKGLGEGGNTTLRNNFDRALASAVSYYNQRDGLRLGLAMAECRDYNNLIRDRIPKALREALDMWIFIYSAADDEIYVIEPSEDI